MIKKRKKLECLMDVRARLNAMAIFYHVNLVLANKRRQAVLDQLNFVAKLTQAAKNDVVLILEKENLHTTRNLQAEENTDHV